MSIETLNEYVAAARRTEPAISGEMRHRFAVAFPDIVDCLREISKLSEKIDALKRFVFYGDRKAIQALFEKLEGDLYHAYVENGQEETAIETVDWEKLPRDRIAATIHLIHGLFGIAGECGEIADDMLNEGNPHLFPLDQDTFHNLQIEAGDALWYFSQLIRAFNIREESFSHPILGMNYPASIDMQKIAEMNIAKLKSRYPEKFTEEAAINRNLAAEVEATNCGYPETQPPEEA